MVKVSTIQKWLIGCCIFFCDLGSDSKHVVSLYLSKQIVNIQRLSFGWFAILKSKGH